MNSKIEFLIIASLRKKFMEALQNQGLPPFWDGFFYFFGFMENPIKKKAESVLEDSAVEKIREDLKKVNRDYRKNYLKLREELILP